MSRHHALGWITEREASWVTWESCVRRWGCLQCVCFQEDLGHAVSGAVAWGVGHGPLCSHSEGAHNKDEMRAQPQRADVGCTSCMRTFVVTVTTAMCVPQHEVTLLREARNVMGRVIQPRTAMRCPGSGQVVPYHVREPRR
jgi:hypothetical protein